jgi:signal transduction histidine kinase
MKMLVQSALEKGPEAGLSGRSLHVIREEIGRLEEAIQLFLDFARPPVVEKTEVNVGSIIDQTVNLIQVRADRLGVSIAQSRPPAGLIAKIDSTQIRQLLLNLLLNALDALSQGGRLEIKLDPKPDACDPLNGPAVTAAGAVDTGRLPMTPQTGKPQRLFSICVTDNGPGIPAQVLDQIFEPFVTTKETGTGLGLSICHRIAEAHGGDLIAFNRPEGGASFLLTLPYEL